MLRQITLWAMVSLLLLGCDTRIHDGGFSQTGFKPVYAKSGDLKELIKTTGPQSMTSTGKIYIKGKYLLVNRPYEGVHIFDNTDNKNPVNLAFLEIPGNVDVSMKGDYLYADYIGKIAVIDLADIQKPRVTQTVELNTEFQNYPPTASQDDFVWRTYFECPDPKKGVVVGWVHTELKSPKCWRDGR